MAEALAGRPTLRGVVVGFGHMGRIHARHLLARPDVALVAVVDPRRPDVAPAPWRERLEGLGPLDFAVIAAPTAAHAALAAPLLAQGVACLVEKPLAADEAPAAALAAHPRLSVNHVERLNPALAALPSGLRPEWLGAERLSPPLPRGRDVDVVLDLMIHDLDLALHLCGGAARELRAVALEVRGPGPDLAEAWVELDGGAVLHAAASRVSPRASRRLRLIGGGSYWSLDLLAGTAAQVPYGAGDLEPTPVGVSPRDAIAALHEQFLAAVRGEASSKRSRIISRSRKA